MNFKIKSFLGARKEYIQRALERKFLTNPEKRVVKAFDVFMKTSNTLGNGFVVCMTDRVFPIDEHNIMVPVSII